MFRTQYIVFQPLESYRNSLIFQQFPYIFSVKTDMLISDKKQQNQKYRCERRFVYGTD